MRRIHPGDPDTVGVEVVFHHLDGEPVSEDAVALKFIDIHGEDLRFCHSTGKWFVWNETQSRWRLDQTALAFSWARKLIREVSLTRGQRQQKVSGKAAFAAGVERFARSDQRVAVIFEIWDRDPMLLGTPGGTVDLRTGELREARREDGITKNTLVTPHAMPECPLWLKFLAEATGGDNGLIRFLQQWCGYCLTGLTIEQALAFLYGGGGNGKGVFQNVFGKIMGDYAVTAAMETFVASKSDRHPTELAMLRGARLVMTSETEKNRAWAESRLKQLTGSDPVTAHFMRRDNFTFIPQFKLNIIGNHMPVLHNVDDAMRRRLNIVPFTRKPAVPDLDLEKKLLPEAPGIALDDRWLPRLAS